MCSSRSSLLLLYLPSIKKEEASNLTSMSDLVWNPSSLASFDNEDELGCRDSELAFHLKLVAILTIFCAGAFGAALPLLGRRLIVFKTDGPYFAVAKAFAVGVILATSLLRVLKGDTLRELYQEVERERERERGREREREGDTI
ncbi:hypothetical protein KP509_25G025400 [Ceratopteris richardii]|uniref:Uncharacterized protein n=1 Tax=Ceratopteris richardii TaxID=49495 RepID=A0A8T2RQJ9_CERRI|nr:hypothetical protein KP509_25G025400 [Ceratopteris richardii]